MFNALLNRHVMVGCDLHDGIPPPGPTPWPRMPHIVGATLQWVLPPGACPLPTARTSGPCGLMFMQQGTDIGNFIPHIWLDYLAPIFTATSGSKSHFGASTVLMEGAPAAAAIAIVVNLNLNCMGPTWPPMPFDVVIAPNSVVVGLTLGDFLGGLFSMVVDALIQFGLNRLFASGRLTRFFNRLQGPIIRALIPNAPAFTTLTTALFGQASRVLSNPYVANTLGNLLPTLVGVALGSPLGYTPPTGVVGKGAGAVSDWARGGGQALGNAISGWVNDPGTPSYPSGGSSGGTSSTTPASSSANP